MSPHIIDCEDRELHFCPDGVNSFRSFYVVPNGDESKPIISERQILVSVQPDRTVQIINASTEESRFEALTDSVNREVQTTNWLDLIEAAFQELKHETVTATYALDDESDASWTAALAAGRFTQKGTIHQFQRPAATVGEVKPSNHHRIQIECFKAETMQVLQSRLPSEKIGPSRGSKAEDIIRLLEDTVRNSDDCPLRSQVKAEDVLALFSRNPRRPQVLLATGKDGAAGILVGDDSDGPNRGHIEYLGVHSEYRRQSVGSLLVNEFQAMMPESGLSVAIHDQNTASVFFFQTLNFCRSQQYRLWTRDMGEH